MCETWRQAGGPNCKVCGRRVIPFDDAPDYVRRYRREPEPVVEEAEAEEPLERERPGMSVGCLLTLGGVAVVAVVGVALVNPWAAAVLALVVMVAFGFHLSRNLGRHEEALAQARLRELELRAELERERRRDAR